MNSVRQRLALAALVAALAWIACGRTIMAGSPAGAGVGDTVHVAAGTRLMRGNDVVATVPRDQDLKILKIEGPWVGVAVNVDGRKRGGWVSRSAGQRTATQYRQRFSYAPETAQQTVPTYQYARPSYSTSRRSSEAIYTLPKTDTRRFGTR